MIYIYYGYRPSEKTVGKGNFICPLCSRKRQYHRIKVHKKGYIGIITFPLAELGEFVQCQSCLKGFPVKVLDAALQLQFKIDERPLPTPDIQEIWEDAYTTTECEALLIEKGHTVEFVTPYLLTMASNMQEVGARLRMEDYEEARRMLFNVLKLSADWQETNARNKWNPEENAPKHHHRILAIMDCAHILLSRLP